MFKLSLFVLVIGAMGPVFAQSNASLEAAGYSAPTPLQVAPGQVVTLFFHGIGTLPNGQLRSAQSDAVPVPKTLAGLTPRITQGQAPAMAVPVFAVRQESECDGVQNPSVACLLTSVKIQIPYEVHADANSASSPLAQFLLDVDGQVTRTFPLQPVPDNVHLLTSCDTSWDTKSTSVCNRSVFHADGTPVTAASPALRGETVVVFGFGLGEPSTPVATGELSPSGAALPGSPESHVKVTLSNVANGLGSGPRFLSSDDPAAPKAAVSFAGLTPGQVGMYQLNILVPQSLDLQVACGAFNGSIRTNSVLQVTTSQGTEIVPFCVQP